MKQSIFNIFMRMIHSELRNNWDMVNHHFKYIFKVNIEKEQWENWKDEDIIF